jgi:hypothetical protein
MDETSPEFRLLEDLRVTQDIDVASNKVVKIDQTGVRSERQNRGVVISPNAEI